MNNIFVGNLSFAATKDDVQKLFAPFGTVVHVAILEKKKGTSRGFGFVDMPNDEERNKAIEALQGQEFMGRVLSVSVVVPKVKKLKPKKFKPGSKKWTEGEEKKPWFKNEAKPPYRRDERSKPGDKKEGFRPEGKARYEGKPFRPKPGLKSEGPAKPYRRDDRDVKSGGKEGGSKPVGNPRYRRDESGPKPLYEEDKEPEGKPYVRNESKGKPWLKMNKVSKPPFKKYDGPSKTRNDQAGPSKPHVKPGGGSKKFYKLGKPSKPWPPKGGQGA